MEAEIIILPLATGTEMKNGVAYKKCVIKNKKELLICVVLLFLINELTVNRYSHLVHADDRWQHPNLKFLEYENLCQKIKKKNKKGH